MNSPSSSFARLAGALRPLAAFVVLATAAHAAIDGAQIEKITSLKGAAAGDAFKVTLPRNDVPVTVDGRAMPPFMGITSWATFAAGKGD